MSILSSAEKKGQHEDSIDIYTVCQRSPDGMGGTWWYTWEEYEGTVISGTRSKDPFDAPPLYAAWLIPVYGDDWGRSYIDEYYGDILALENLSKALMDSAAIASWILFLVSPESATRLKDLQDAPNMAWRAGREG